MASALFLTLIFAIAPVRADGGTPPEYHVRPVGPARSPRQQPPRPPSAAEIDRAFARAQLTDQVASMDQLDKDLLYFRASHESFESLAAHYPHLAAQNLQSLHALLSPAGTGGESR